MLSYIKFFDYVIAKSLESIYPKTIELGWGMLATIFLLILNIQSK